MIEYYNILLELTNFLLVAIIFLLMLSICLNILLKKFKLDRNKIKFYGLFLEMDNKSIISFSLISLNYLFLIWCVTSFSMNYIYVIISTLLVIISDLVLLNYPKGFINIINNIIICIIIYITSNMYNYIVFNTNNYVLVILILLVIFLYMYITFTMFKTLNNVVIKHKYLRRKNYEKNK